MRKSPLALVGFFNLEAASGFEPEHKGFADLSLSHLGMPPFFLERETGFEPATSTLARLHSTTELFPHIINFKLYKIYTSMSSVFWGQATSFDG